MTIFANNLKRIFKSKIQLVFIILLPFMFMSLALFQSNELEIKVAVIDKDQTVLTETLADQLKGKAKMVTVSESDIEKQLFMLKVDYVVVLEKGFTDQLIRGEKAGVQGYYVKESNMSHPIRVLVDGFIGGANVLALAANHDQARFYHALGDYVDGDLKLQNVSMQHEKTQTSRSVLGYLALAMLYSSTVCSFMILMNKNNRTFYRTIAASVSVRSYMFQTVCSFLAVSFVQVSLLFLFLRFGIDLYLGESAFEMYLLFIAFSFVSVALGITISAFSKTVTQAGIIGIAVVPPMAMLGGAYWPIDNAPEALQKMADFVPVTWAMKGAEELLKGHPLWQIGGHIAILGLFAVILFLLGSMRKADIAR